MTTRQQTIDEAYRLFDSGDFLAMLRPLVALRTESQEKNRNDELQRYLTAGIAPHLTAMGFTINLQPNPQSAHGDFLIAARHEDDGLPTILIYGHADTVRCEPAQWRNNLDPLAVTIDGNRWYGRGTADNKGQHAINIAALRTVLDARGGRLGFNVRIIFETGEEVGSPGLHEICRRHRDALAADVLIASDGPRLTADRPTIFLGSRGMVRFGLSVDLRDDAHHSGNWGGLLRNPGTVLAHAIATLVDARGAILVEGLRPPPITPAVREALAGIEVSGGPDDPAIDPDWGEPGLTPEERVFGWNALEVLAFRTGNPDRPLNAIPGTASAMMQLRYVVGTDVSKLAQVLREHLDKAGLPWAKVDTNLSETMVATRLDPDDPWVTWAKASITKTTGAPPAILPNLGGSIPNDAFADILGMPTIWIPHSYPGCLQHGPNEHLLGTVVRDGLAIMAGLFWDLGEVEQFSREHGMPIASLSQA